ncbi:MAG: class I SAM-dependent methyltransferase [Anaerolineae bacterium]
MTPAAIRRKWNRRYTELHPSARQQPNPFVTACLPQLPASGRALDIAAGAGRHSLALAAHGLQVDALDISWQGLRLAQQRATMAGLAERVRCVVADVERGWLPRHSYDVIVTTYFLCRPLFNTIASRLRPGGFLLYETFTLKQLEKPYHRGSSRAGFYLRPGELRAAFAGFNVLYYDEGDHQDKATAQLLAQKPVTC